MMVLTNNLIVFSPSRLALGGQKLYITHVPVIPSVPKISIQYLIDTQYISYECMNIDSIKSGGTGTRMLGKRNKYML